MKCPHCFRVLPPRVAMLSCAGSCQKTTPGRQNIYNGGIDIEVRPAFTADGGSCPECQVPSTTEACPWCWGEIPAVWRTAPGLEVTCVAMAGAISTAKSMYIGVLKPQLELFVDHQVGSVLDPLLDTENRWMERYGERIFVDKKKLRATVEIKRDSRLAEPLVWTFKDANGKARALSIRDVAGEDMEDLPNRKARLEFLTRADGIVLLIDPRQIDEINQVLRGRVQAREIGGNGVEILRHLVAFLRESNGGVAPPVPIAVTLSMIDVLQMLRDTDSPLRPLMVRPGSPLRRDPSRRAVRSRVDSDLLHAEIESLLLSLMGPRLRNVLDQAGQPYRYFAIAPLGAETDDEDINPAGIMPFRVLDPLRWILKL